MVIYIPCHNEFESEQAYEKESFSDFVCVG